jgi:hypothetical protein
VSAADNERAIGAAPTDTPPALAAAPATDTASQAAATAGVVDTAVGPVPNVSDAVSAMLAAAIPGASFVDPLGGADEPAISASKPEGQDADPSSANGSEAAT